MKSDETLLAWLRLRDEGKSCRQIAKLFGVPRGTVIRGLWKIDTELAASEGRR